MIRKHPALWASLIAFLVNPVFLPAQDPAATRTGKVFDKASNAPMVEFEITILEAGDIRSAGKAREIRSLKLRSQTGEFKLSDLPDSPVLLKVSAPGYLTQFVSATASSSNDPLQISMERGTPVRGRVTLPNGTPVSGVEVSHEIRAFSPSHTGSRERVFTDTRGQYVTWVGGGDTLLRFAKPGMISEQKHHSAPAKDAPVPEKAPPPAPLDVTMMAAESIRGKVIDDTGVPVARARVRASWEERAGEIVEATTDKDGAFALKPIRPGKHKVEVTRGGSSPATVPLDLPRTSNLDVTLNRGATVRGKVTGASDEEKSMVMIYFSSGPSTGINAASEYGLVGVPPGQAAVYAEVTAEGLLKRSETRMVTLANGQEAHLDLEFKNRPVISGKVLEGEEPVVRAVVVFTPVEKSPVPAARMMSDEQGSYQVIGLQQGEVEIQVEGRELLASKRFLVSEDETLDLAVGPAKPREELLPRAPGSGPSKTPNVAPPKPATPGP